jgi:hypothetical protein
MDTEVNASLNPGSEAQITETVGNRRNLDRR